MYRLSSVKRYSCCLLAGKNELMHKSNGDLYSNGVQHQVRLNEAFYIQRTCLYNIFTLTEW